jgi:SAM-dependent methyltransferase
MHALEQLGFTRLLGLDLSWPLASRYAGSASVVVADCRDIPIASRKIDVAIVQGGLHHLPSLPGDLERTVAEVARILEPGGRFVVVEPWHTPFLGAVHWLTKRPLARRAWPRLDALATMIEHELPTYSAWLGQSALVLSILRRYFPDSTVRTGLGKLTFVGRRC